MIPAHDEERVIGRCLRALLQDSTEGEWEIFVVANGCTDRTAAVARATAPGATVVELSEASKVAALNAGDELASAYPRAFLDADVEVSSASLRAVVEALEADDGPLCAAPTMRLVLDDRRWYIRCFYRAFSRLPYLADDLVGHGLYVLSEHGRGRFTSFPEITADDLFVRNLFAPGERASVRSGSFTVHPPRTITGLLAIRQRAYRGNDEYVQAGYSSRAERTFDRSRIARELVRYPLDTSVWLAVNAIAKVQLRLRRGDDTRWERDESGRE